MSVQDIYQPVIRKKIEDFEELIKSNKFSKSFDAKSLRSRFRRVKTVIHVDCFYDKDRIPLTMEDAMSDTVSLHKAIVERNPSVPIIEWISRGHTVLQCRMSLPGNSGRSFFVFLTRLTQHHISASKYVY